MKKNVAFTITLIRGLLAISLGAVLLFQPNKTRPILANFMGMFWLASGITSLRWSASGARARRMGVLAGAIGVLTGLGILTRGLTDAWIRQDIMFSLVGALILLTGILHTFGGFRVGDVNSGNTFEYLGIKLTLDHIFASGIEDSISGVWRGSDASDHFPIWSKFQIQSD